MSSNWLRGSNNRKQNANRRLLVEPLEDRSLLSLTFGPTGPANPPAMDPGQYGPNLGPIAAVATHYALKLPASVPTGLAVPVQAVALDAQNHPVFNYTGTAKVTSTDTAAALPANPVQFKFGYATFPVVFGTTGDQTVTLTDTTSDKFVGSGKTTVTVPAAATQFALYLPPTVPTGVAVTVKAVALDAQNRPTAYSGSVTPSSTDSSATFAPNPVVFQNGETSFTVTFTAAGSQTVTLTDANKLTGSANTNVVVPAAATHFALRLPLQVQTGVAVTVDAVALDAQNRPVPNFNGSADLSSTDTGATFSAPSVTFKNGQATFTVTFATGGKQTVTLTDKPDNLTGAATTNVVVPAAATHFFLMLPPVVPKGAPVRVDAVVLDAQNRPVMNYTGPVTVSSTDGAATLPTGGIVKFQDGRASFMVTFGTAGDQTLTLLDANKLTGSATTKVVVPAVATHFALKLPPSVPAGAPVAVDAVALDAQDRPVLGYSGPVTVSCTDGKALLPPNATVMFNNGHAPFVVTFGTAGDQTLTLLDANKLTGSATTKVVVPVAVAHFAIMLPPVAPIGAMLEVKVMALDAQFKPMLGYNGTAKVTSTDTKALLPPGPVQFKDGVAFFKVSFGTLGQWALTVTDTTDNTMSGTALIAVLPPPHM